MAASMVIPKWRFHEINKNLRNQQQDTHIQQENLMMTQRASLKSILKTSE